MNKTTKKYLVKLLLSPLILVVLLWLIYHQVTAKGSLQAQWQEMVTHWQSGSRLLIIIAFSLSPLNWLCEAKKWHYLINKIEPLSFAGAFASVMTGLATALVTPSKVGDFAGRILYVKNKNKLRAIFASLITSLSQTLVTFVLGLAGLIYLNIYYPGQWQLIALLVAILICALLGYCYFRIELLADWAERYKWLRKIVIAIRVLRRYDKKDLLRILALSALRFCIYNLQFVVFLQVFGIDASPAALLALSACMFWMITVIPSFFVADLGVRAYVANLVFVHTGIVGNSVSIIAASYMVWLLNWALAAVIGSLLVLTVKWSR
jgi:hypothetical protein